MKEPRPETGATLELLESSNAGSATVSSLSEIANGTPVLVNATAVTTHAGTTDSIISPDGQFLYVQSGAAGSIDSFKIKADGSLSPVTTVWNIPVAAEGIVAS
jgi:6-phosphogluconolactonase (cycloisomerase 2 family)